MRVKKILMGLSTVAAAALVGACSAAGATTAGTALPSAPATPATSSAAPSTPQSPPAPPKSSSAAPVKEKKEMAPGVPCTVTAKACVDLSSHQAWLLEDGKITYGPVKTMPGKAGSTTPLGTWKVLYKEKMHLSREFDNAPMPNSVFFYNGVAFHQGSLSRYSNGCVHLSPSASLKFFTTLDRGDEVQVVK
ncbi:L,D-transpeptidase [Amycolatopsis sp. PS_44_ISF1]|uniref:L,D-transpeptidase n=1 Tax=Amycolatopsis sp. PS_44_ISF1 TaxID=2974917 RepID=UPI0028DD8D6C|nr:L,D-transpeptidase [Amycolatopsis sp. PS_44_ISF1]MDT8910793.1 L,D-transpeptidase [Amycolatopsis sp. PS_44_ISF1]